MCLVYSTTDPKTIKRGLSKYSKTDYVRVYKKAYYDRCGGIKRRTGYCWGIRWRKGIRKIVDSRPSNECGWYAYLEKPKKEYKNYPTKVCIVKKKWVVEFGNQIGSRKKAVRCNCMAFPSWNKGKLTVREFRQMCKKAKV
jgi:hypothetical protein